MTTINHPVMRYHGAKFRLAPWVMSFFPNHTTYVEPFGGAAGVLLQKPVSKSEVYNDLDGDIVNVFSVLRDRQLSDQLVEQLLLTPYSRSEFELSYESSTDPIEQARRTLIRAQMGFGSSGATKGKTGFRCDSVRAYGTNAALWSRYPNIVAEFNQRLQGVIIENKCALKVIENHDRPDTLFFIDPPYVHATRSMGSNRYYRHEMSDAQHLELIDLIKSLQGMVVLSGYRSEIYDKQLKHWETHSTTARIALGRGGGTRIENVWLNPAAAAMQKQKSLFI